MITLEKADSFVGLIYMLKHMKIKYEIKASKHFTYLNFFGNRITYDKDTGWMRVDEHWFKDNASMIVIDAGGNHHVIVCGWIFGDYRIVINDKFTPRNKPKEQLQF